MQFIFCLCLSKEGPQLLWAKKITPQPGSLQVGILPLWCCKTISAAEVTRIEVVLKLSTEGELWHFCGDVWAEGVGDCPCQLSPFFFCHRGRSSLPLLKSVWTHSTPQGTYMMSDFLSLFLLGFRTWSAQMTQKAELSNPTLFICLSCITPFPKFCVWQFWDFIQLLNFSHCQNWWM